MAHIIYVSNSNNRFCRATNSCQHPMDQDVEASNDRLEQQRFQELQHHQSVEYERLKAANANMMASQQEAYRLSQLGAQAASSAAGPEADKHDDEWLLAGKRSQGKEVADLPEPAAKTKKDNLKVSGTSVSKAAQRKANKEAREQAQEDEDAEAEQEIADFIAS